MWKKIVVVLLAVGLVAVFVNAYVLFGGFGPWRVFAPSAPVPVTSRISDARYAPAGEAALDLLARHQLEQGFPSITAAVAAAGELVWSGSVGWANVEEGIAAGPDTVYRIGSTSKAVTATALARLVDDGELSLDAPIATYAPELPQAWWRPLTLRMLASHTAGITDYDKNRDLSGMYISLCGCVAYDSVTAALEMIDGNDEPLYTPGADFLYSSYDVNLIGAVMERNQGKHYLKVLQEQVLAPLGLERTRGAHADANSAVFYEIRKREEDGETQLRRWRAFDLSQRIPSGGLYSTSADLVEIGSAWLDPSFISAATRRTMLTPQRLQDGSVNEQSYAVGWRSDPDYPHPLHGDAGLPRFHHGGVSKGAMSWLVVYPTVGLVVALNINTRASTFAEFANVEKHISRIFLAAMQTPTGRPMTTAR